MAERTHRLTLFVLSSCFLASPMAHAQELIPGAYLPGPVGVNVLTISGSVNRGGVTFDPALPIEENRATIFTSVLGLARLFSLGGRYANVRVGVPLVHGHIEGLVAEEFQEVTRRGAGDILARLGVNLYGARAMTPKEFAGYRSSTIVGVSLGVSMPIGQYNSTRVINIGSNRWAFNTELGIARTRGHWTVEGDVGMVFFTDNTNYLDGGLREQAPIVTFQGHLIYTVRPGYWMAFDGNFWHGGLVTTNGVPGTEEQHNSRLGATLAVPIRRQQLRFAFSMGAYTRLGGDFTSFGVSYSYAWQ